MNSSRATEDWNCDCTLHDATTGGGAQRGRVRYLDSPPIDSGEKRRAVHGAVGAGRGVVGAVSTSRALVIVGF